MAGLTWLFAYGSLVVFLAVGATASIYHSWLPGSLITALALWLWLDLHRRRMCTFCPHQECPGHPLEDPPRHAEPGFRGWERRAFYGLFPLVVLAMLVSVLLMDVALGISVSALLLAGLAVYARRVCVSCTLPCPVARLLRARAETSRAGAH